MLLSVVVENEVIVDPRKEELISQLKTGKNFLRSQDHEKAYAEFKTALELAQNLKDPTEGKKAARDLGASLQRQGKYREAIKCHSMVLDFWPSLSEKEKTLETLKLKESLLIAILNLEILKEPENSMTSILLGWIQTGPISSSADSISLTEAEKRIEEAFGCLQIVPFGIYFMELHIQMHQL